MPRAWFMAAVLVLALAARVEASDRALIVPSVRLSAVPRRAWSMTPELRCAAAWPMDVGPRRAEETPPLAEPERTPTEQEAPVEVLPPVAVDPEQERAAQAVAEAVAQTVYDALAEEELASPDDVRVETPTTPTPSELPAGRAIAELEPEACTSLLSAQGVAFERAEGDAVRAVPAAVRLTGPLGGIVIEPEDESALHATLDCRLALALLAWAPALRALGVQRLVHYSAFRPGAVVEGTGRPSGHARGLALDAARLVLGDGRTVDVLHDWLDRTPGAHPCPGLDTGRRDAAPDAHAEPGELQREVVCSAVRDGLFQVVITPHHDAAHANHVHLEVVPRASWTYVR